jgi:hypothetical protein
MKYLIGFPIAWAVGYLIFAFIHLSWDVATWTSVDRAFCSVFGMVWGVALAYRINKDCSWNY